MPGGEELSRDTLDPETASTLGSDTADAVTVMDTGGEDTGNIHASAAETGAVTENRL